MERHHLDTPREATAAWTNATLANHAFDPDRQPVLDIVPSTSVTAMQAAVSPDCSYRLVQAAIDGAEQEICLYIDNVSAGHLVALLRNAKERGVRIRLMYDVNDTRGGERDTLESLGVDLKAAPSSGNRRVFTHCHQNATSSSRSSTRPRSCSAARTGPGPRSR